MGSRRVRVGVVAVSILLLTAVVSGAIVLVTRPQQSHLSVQQTLCGFNEAQVHLTGINPGKGGTRSVTSGGICAGQYFILAQGSGSYFSLDPSVASNSLGVAVVYYLEASG